MMDDYLGITEMQPEYFPREVYVGRAQICLLCTCQLIVVSHCKYTIVV